jgi:hypothetical protein
MGMRRLGLIEGAVYNREGGTASLRMSPMGRIFKDLERKCVNSEEWGFQEMVTEVQSAWGMQGLEFRLPRNVVREHGL